MVVGYPPFDSFLFKEEELVGQWVATFGELPTEWEGLPMARNCCKLPLSQNHAIVLRADDTDVPVGTVDMETVDLVQWLHETYYDDDKPPYFTKIDLQAISKVLLSLFRFRPSERSSASEIFLELSLGNRSSAECNEDGLWK